MIRIRSITTVASIFLLSLPAFVYASGITAIVPQSPAGKEACPLGYGAILLLVQNITNDAIYLAGVFAVLLIAYAGFLFVTNATSPSNLEKGRNVLISTVIGFVIVISAWLIVNEVIVVFTTGNLQSVTALLKPSSTSLCLPTVKLKTPKQIGALKIATAAAKKEAIVRAEFSKANISINKKACPSGVSSYKKVPGGCTTVGGMRPATIQQIINIKQACGNTCSVTITGGSEPGHALGIYTHGRGYKVDLRSVGSGAALSYWISNGANGYIKRSKPRRGDCAGTSPTYNDVCGNQYVIESGNGSTCWAHWDITVYRVCSLTKPK